MGMELLLIFQEPAMNGTRLHSAQIIYTNFFSNSIEFSMYTLLKVREVENERSSYFKSTFFRQRICTGLREGNEHLTTIEMVLRQ